MDDVVRANQAAWDDASIKHLDEYEDLLREARTATLDQPERRILEPLLRDGPEVVHLQSGHGIDDHALVRAGARRVIGVDYSRVAVEAANRRAEELRAPIGYLVSEVPGTPLPDASADMVYTGKGALIWMRDLDAWAAEVSRLLRPAGHVFLLEAHPMVPLWTWDEDEPRIRPDRSYFAGHHVNDTFPGRGAVEWQWNLGHVVSALVDAGLSVRELSEHPEPFWRPDDVDAAAWAGRLPNTYTLLASKS